MAEEEKVEHPDPADANSGMEDTSALDLGQLRTLVGQLKDSRGHSETVLQTLREELEVLRELHEQQQQQSYHGEEKQEEEDQCEADAAEKALPTIPEQPQQQEQEKQEASSQELEDARKEILRLQKENEELRQSFEQEAAPEEEGRNTKDGPSDSGDSDESEGETEDKDENKSKNDSSIHLSEEENAEREIGETENAEDCDEIKDSLSNEDTSKTGDKAETNIDSAGKDDDSEVKVSSIQNDAEDIIGEAKAGSIDEKQDGHGGETAIENPKSLEEETKTDSSRKDNEEETKTDEKVSENDDTATEKPPLDEETRKEIRRMKKKINRAVRQAEKLKAKKAQLEHELRTSRFREDEAVVFLRRFRSFYYLIWRNNVVRGSGGFRVNKIALVPAGSENQPPGAADERDLLELDNLMVESGLLEPEEIGKETTDDKRGPYRPSQAAFGRSTNVAAEIAKRNAMANSAIQWGRSPPSAKPVAGGGGGGMEIPASKKGPLSAINRLERPKTVEARQHMLGTPAGRLLVLREKSLEEEVKQQADRIQNLRQELEDEKRKKDATVTDAKLTEETNVLRRQMQTKEADMRMIVTKLRESSVLNWKIHETLKKQEEHILYLESKLSGARVLKSNSGVPPGGVPVSQSTLPKDNEPIDSGVPKLTPYQKFKSVTSGDGQKQLKQFQKPGFAAKTIRDVLLQQQQQQQKQQQPRLDRAPVAATSISSSESSMARKYPATMRGAQPTAFTAAINAELAGRIGTRIATPPKAAEDQSQGGSVSISQSNSGSFSTKPEGPPPTKIVYSDQIAYEKVLARQRERQAENEKQEANDKASSVGGMTTDSSVPGMDSSAMSSSGRLPREFRGVQPSPQDSWRRRKEAKQAASGGASVSGDTKTSESSASERPAWMQKLKPKTDPTSVPAWRKKLENNTSAQSFDGGPVPLRKTGISVSSPAPAPAPPPAVLAPEVPAPTANLTPEVLSPAPASPPTPPPTVSAPAPIPSPPPAKKGGILDSDSDSDSDIPPTKAAPPEKPSSPAPPAKTGGLLDSDSDSDSDIPPKKAAPPTDLAPPKKTGGFLDSDSDSQSDAPPKKAAPPEKPPAMAHPKKTVGFLDSDSDSQDSSTKKTNPVTSGSESAPPPPQKAAPPVPAPSTKKSSFLDDSDSDSDSS